MNALSICFCVGLASGPPTASAPADEAAAALPEAVRPYAALARRAQRYHTLLSSRRWQTVWSEQFARRKPVPWSLPRPHDHLAVSFAADEGRDVLKIAINAETNGYVAFGPKVDDDFAIEIVGKAVSARPCDLSLTTAADNKAPGFFFGAHYNTANKLGVDSVARNRAAVTWRTITLSDPTRIQPGVLHRVRLAVCDGTIAGYVDGRLVGRAWLSKTYDTEARRQPMVYVYGSTVLIDQAIVQQRRAADALKRPQAFAEAFGDATAADVRRQIEALTLLMDHEDFATREATQTLLRQIGSLAVPALKVLADGGSVEAKWRARKLLDLLPDEAPYPAAPTQPAD